MDGKGGDESLLSVQGRGREEGKINTSPCILISCSRCWSVYVAALFDRLGLGKGGVLRGWGCTARAAGPRRAQWADAFALGRAWRAAWGK